MSRNISSASKSPVKKFIEYKGGDGHFEYYDKEKKERIEISLPLTFIVLDDTRMTVTGFNDESNSGIYSNEVGKPSGSLRVKSHRGGIIAEGPWDKIKDKVTSKNVGGRYCKVVYAIVKTDNTEDHPSGWEYVAFKFDGAAIGAWFEFSGSADLMDYGVKIVDEFIDAKKGKTEYKVPVFESVRLSKDSVAVADKMYGPLKEYFQRYDSRDLDEVESGSGFPKEEFSGDEPEKSSQFSNFDKPTKDPFAKDTKDAKDEPASRVRETSEGTRNVNVSDDDLPF